MVVALAIVGYVLTLVGVLTVGPVTAHAFRKMRTDLAAEEQHKLDNLRVFHHDPGQSPFKSEDEIQADYAARLKAADLPFSPGFSIGTDNSETVRIAVARIGKANRLNIALALAGGALSTLAAVLAEVAHP